MREGGRGSVKEGVEGRDRGVRCFYFRFVHRYYANNDESWSFHSYILVIVGVVITQVKTFNVKTIAIETGTPFLMAAYTYPGVH